ncbi:hypothetical protein FHG87_015544 [Trinorchestia longiramus]|nr:hypothetical protein FHG87_015544 [Trinorchestia longiramus]
MYDIPFDKTIQNVVTLQAHTSAYVDIENEKKLVFLTRLLELLLQNQFSMNDYCFALQSYPKCNYEEIRDFLVLPCKLKLQYITSSIDKDQVLRETFDKVQILQQKNVFLLVDEVQIRTTVSFPGGLLSGMAENNRDCKATSILITSSVTGRKREREGDKERETRREGEKEIKRNREGKRKRERERKRKRQAAAARTASDTTSALQMTLRICLLTDVKDVRNTAAKQASELSKAFITLF